MFVLLFAYSFSFPLFVCLVSFNFICHTSGPFLEEGQLWYVSSLEGLTRSASRGRVMVCGHSSSPGPLTGRSQRKRCALLVSFTLHDSCHPGHEGTAKFSTGQGKVAHPVSQFRMRFRYSNCYRFTERVQWSEDPSMGEISLMI